MADADAEVAVLAKWLRVSNLSGEADDRSAVTGPSAGASISAHAADGEGATADQRAAEFVSRLTNGVHVGAIIHEHVLALCVSNLRARHGGSTIGLMRFRLRKAPT